MRGDRASHPLDGHGFIRAFSLQVPAAGRHARDPHTRQRATVLGRFVRTWAFELESFFGTNVFRGFFSLPFAPDSLPARLFNGFAMLRKNVANTAVVDWGGRLLALWEMGPPHALDYALKTDTKWDHCSRVRRADTSPMDRGDAAAATWIFRGRRVAATPRPRRGHLVGDGSRRRRGRNADVP